MKAEPKPRQRTRGKHVAQAHVTIGRTTPESLRHEISASRRADVYRTDVEFTSSDEKQHRVPAIGSRERAELIAEIVRLRESGLSYLKIGLTLDPPRSQSTVSNLLNEYKKMRAEERK
jgi:hypothetical protein